MNTIGHISGSPFIRKLRVHSHPISRRPGKLDHPRSRIAPQQIFLQLHCVGFVRERPNLHAPSSTRIGIRPNRCSKRLHLHLRDPDAINPRSLRRSQRQVDDPPPHKRPSVSNLHHDRLVRGQVRHPNHRPHRQCQVRGCHCILVIHCAIGTFASGIRRPIPTRQSNLRRNRITQILRHRRRGGNRRGSRLVGAG
jgi:hypothetical protein